MSKNVELMGFAAIGLSWQDWCSNLDTLIEDATISNAEAKPLINENLD